MIYSLQTSPLLKAEQIKKGEINTGSRSSKVTKTPSPHLTTACTAYPPPVQEDCGVFVSDIMRVQHTNGNIT